MNEIIKVRTGQDVDLKPEKLFDDGRFDLKKFNAAFDMIHKREGDAITPYDGIPSAWNDFGKVVNYGSFDALDNLYVEDDKRVDTGRQIYGNVDFGGPTKK